MGIDAKARITPKMTAGNVGQLMASLSAMIEAIADTNADQVYEMVMPKVQEKILTTYGPLPEKHEIIFPDRKKTITTGAVHEKFEEVLKIVSMDIPVYLMGPAGTGKNVIAKQVAEACDLPFYFTNAVTQEYKLTGFIDANGHYQETQFYKAFKDGGLFFLDEMDASIPEVLIILNAAIANRYFDFPIGKVEAHPDFRIIAAGNTRGTGADTNYTGRYCLDRASLDRFARIPINYSIKIENAVTGSNKELLTFCHSFRQMTEKCGVNCIFSYRALDRITKLEGAFNNLSEVLNMSLLSDLDDDTLNIIKGWYKNSEYSNNKYVKALLRISAWDF